MATHNRRARARKSSVTRPKILAGYLRLTVDRNGNKIGYTTQQEAIQKYATAYGYEVEWFKDADITAADRKIVRPEYEKMLKRVAAGEFSGIIVWRLDRLVRLTREFERCYGIVEDAKAFIIDVEAGHNSTQASGKMVMRMLVIFAEMEIAAMRARASAHQNWRAMNGKPSTGGARPLGFVGAEKDADGKVTNPAEAWIKHVPEEAAHLRAAAERIAYGGATYSDIAREWADANPPMLGTLGSALSGGRLRDILTAPRIAGLREYDIFDNDGEFLDVGTSKAAWEPIIEPEVWEILKLRAEGAARAPRSTHNEHLLTGGLAKCGECGGMMIGTTTLSRGSDRRVPAYKCNPSVQARATGNCGKPLIRAGYLEDTVLEQLFARLNASPELHDLVNAGADADVVAERESLRREIKLCDETLRDLGNRVALHEDDPRYLTDAESSGRASGFRKRRREAKKALQGLGSDKGYPVPNDKDRKNIPAWFEGLSLGEKRSWLAAHIVDVFVDARLKRTNTFDPSRVRTLFADPKHGG